MPSLSHLYAREILDSKGDPTVEVELILSDGSHAVDASPSGSSTGTSEALEIRDGDSAWYQGRGVKKAVSHINEILFPKLKDQDFTSQKSLDEKLLELDGTSDKSNIGANAMLPVSLAFARATAASRGQALYRYLGEICSLSSFTLPTPAVLVMEGGKHGNWSTDIQEYMVRPHPGFFPTFSASLEACNDIFRALKDSLSLKHYGTGVGMEGAFCPAELSSNEEALELICAAIEKAGYSLSDQFTLAVDFASSEFFREGRYVLASEKGAVYTPSAWMDKVISWSTKYPLWSLEDPFDQESWSDWVQLQERIGSDHQLVADDLTTTNTTRIQQAIDQKAANAVIIKPNQIGTLTETLQAISLAKSAGFIPIVSHRAGETTDDFAADLAVGSGCPQCKFGGPDRGERVAKYNRLLTIESDLLK